MAVKAVVTKDEYEKLPAELKKEYTQEGDEYVLDFSEDEAKKHPATGALRRALDRVRKDRDGAQDKLKELEEKVESFGDLDPAAARDALEKVSKLTEKELADGGKVEELVGKKVEAVKRDFEKREKAIQDALKAEQEKALGLTGQLTDLKINTAVRDSALRAGGRKTALDDIMNRARTVFRLDEKGNVLPYRKGEDGADEVMFGKGGDPMTIDEWMGELSGSAEHLFESNKGGGATGGGGGGATGGKVISRDQAGQNLEGIADGTVTIR